jgi:uncharacterized protein YegJ (DUF2314 family)
MGRFYAAVVRCRFSRRRIGPIVPIMWPFLPKPTVHGGVVLYRGSLAPPIDQIVALADGTAGISATRVDAADDAFAGPAVRLTHPVWGEALVGVPDDLWLPSDDILKWGTSSLTDAERELASHAEQALLVRVTTPERRVTRARKYLLRWLRLLMSLDGLVANDLQSQLFWSAAMLDDELAHDAELDVEALFTIHAVYQEVGDQRDVYWMHTHGLEELGAFDVDVLRPSVQLAQNAGDPMRALAFAALEGLVTPSTTGFVMGMPGGAVDFVPASDFDAGASKEDAMLRLNDAAHTGTRAVLCEPRGLFGFLRKKPIPSKFLSRVGDGAVFAFSKEASSLMAARAHATLDVFKGLVAEFGPTGCPTLAKIGYETASDSTTREHLWFEVHGFDGDRIDGTLVNQPFDVPSLQKDARGWHPAADVSDWIVMSPAGPMTPRNLSAARRLRESGWPDGVYGGMAKPPVA